MSDPKSYKYIAEGSQQPSESSGDKSGKRKRAVSTAKRSPERYDMTKDNLGSSNSAAWSQVVPNTDAFPTWQVDTQDPAQQIL